MITFPFKWNKWSGYLQPRQYDNERLALLFVDDEDEAPIAKVTLNIPDYDLSRDHVIIKDYAENNGILQALLNHKYVEEPCDSIAIGHVSVPVCKLLIDFWASEQLCKKDAND